MRAGKVIGSTLLVSAIIGSAGVGTSAVAVAKSRATTVTSTGHHNRDLPHDNGPAAGQPAAPVGATAVQVTLKASNESGRACFDDTNIAW